MNAFGRAALQPLAIVVGVCALVGGVVVTWWLLPLGLLAYAAMVALAARDPQLQLAPPPKVTRPQLSSPTFRAQIEAIERTTQAISRSIGQSSGSLRALLARIDDQARELLREAYTLAGKGQEIEQYLVGVNQNAIQKQIEALDIRLRSTQDPYTRDQLGETRQALTDRQSNARDLETYIERINAQLQNIAANLENVQAETVRLRTSDAVSADTATNQVAQRLTDLKADMDAFQSVLDTALTQTAHAP
ncbi:hypothetical protein F8S13_12350 [Chloroflexia bacterium SDU3-3]|nr:hypothetical protein F8S13_12350 [Chloroflexia bacterium SDU3-3]